MEKKLEKSLATNVICKENKQKKYIRIRADVQVNIRIRIFQKSTPGTSLAVFTSQCLSTIHCLYHFLCYGRFVEN